MKTMERVLPSAATPTPGAPTLPAGVLERALGKPRPEWTIEDLVGYVRNTGVRLVSLMHVGGDGFLKTLDFVPRDENHLRDILAAGERADGSSLFTGLTSGGSDIVLRPRPSSAFLDPFSRYPTLAVMCAHYDPHGKPLGQSPDTILQRAFERARAELGVDLWALGEIEFFLGMKIPDHAYFEGNDHGYHATAPAVFGEDLRREALVLLAEMGIPVKYGHSEVGSAQTLEAEPMVWEQHEIELGLAPLPQAAEAVIFTRWVLANLAYRHGLKCTFAPVLQEGHAGTGLHFHFAPTRNGAPLPVFDEQESLSEPAQWLIGGLVQLGGALMAFGNRGDKSFLRLRQGKEAPTSVRWGMFDRRGLVRIPVVASADGGRRTTAQTVEFRLPDGSAHPHLLLASVAQTMVFGRATPDLPELLRRTSARKVGGSHDAAEADPSHAVPHSVTQVAVALQHHRQVLEAGGVFPADLIEGVLRTMEP